MLKQSIPSLWLCLCIGYVVCYNVPLHAQEWNPIRLHLTTQDGLPTNCVYDVLQDHRGYLWFATDKGPVRYDGLHFKTFDCHQQPVFKLYEDYKGRIWLLGYDIQFEEQGVIYKPPKYETIRSQLNEHTIVNFHVDSSDHIWFTTNGVFATNPIIEHISYMKEDYRVALIQVTDDSLIFHNPKSVDKVRRFQIPENTCLPTYVNEVYYTFEHQGLPYISSITSFFHLPFSSLYFPDPALFENKPFQSKILFLPPVHLIYGSDTSEWIISQTEILKVKNGIVLHYDPPKVPRTFLKVFEDQQQNVWFCSRNGLWIAPKGDHDRIAHLPFLRGYTVTSMFQDKQGTYWFSTIEAGVLSIRSFDLLMLQWRGDASATSIYQVETFQDEFWFVNQAAGLFTFNPIEQPQKVFQFQTRTPPNISNIRDSLLYTSYQWTFKDKETPVPPIGPSTNRLWFRQIQLDRKDHFWISTRSGFHAYDLSNDRRFLNSANLGFKESIYALYMDNKDRLWVGGKDHLISFDGQQFVYYQDYYPQLHTAHDKVVSIIPFQDTTLLVAKHGVGLFWLQPPEYGPPFERKIETFNADINHVLLVDDSLMWLATDKGIQLLTFQADSQTWKSSGFLNQGDGLPGSIVRNIAHREGWYAAATEEGLVCFRRENLSPNLKQTLSLQLTQVNYADTTLNEPQEITLPAGTRQVVLHYQGITYRLPKTLRYRYRLLGQDSSWQETPDPSIQYTNLSPGNYTFEIQARTSETDWSDPHQYPLVLPPTLTQTLAFKALSLGLVICLSFFFAFLILRTIGRRQRMERRMNTLSYQALQSQMSPHFIFNAMNSILYLINTHQRREAGRYLTSFARLLRGILDDAEQPFLPLIDELERAQQYLELEQLQFGEALTYFININDNLQAHKLLSPQMLLQPFLENAIRHGISPKGEGKISLCISDHDDHLVISIEDNGVGRRIAKQINRPHHIEKKGHLGIENTHARIESLNRLFNLDISLQIIDLSDGNQATGTRVEVKLPKIFQHPIHEHRYH